MVQRPDPELKTRIEAFLLDRRSKNKILDPPPALPLEDDMDTQMDTT